MFYLFIHLLFLRHVFDSMYRTGADWRRHLCWGFFCPTSYSKFIIAITCKSVTAFIKKHVRLKYLFCNNDWHFFSNSVKFLAFQPPISRVNEAIEQVKRYNDEGRPWVRDRNRRTDRPASLIRFVIAFAFPFLAFKGFLSRSDLILFNDRITSHIILCSQHRHVFRFTSSCFILLGFTSVQTGINAVSNIIPSIQATGVPKF